MKKIYVLVGILFLVIGCEQEQLPSPEEYNDEIKATLFTKKEVMTQNLQVKAFLNEFEGAISTYLKSSSKSSGDTEDFKILEEQVKYLEYNDYHSYTFEIERSNSRYKLENLLLSLRHDGSYKSYLVLYDISENERNLLLEGRELDLSDKIFFQRIDFGSTHSLFKSSNLQEAINECPSGLCCEIVKDVSQGTGWDIYVTNIITCPSNNQPIDGGGGGTPINPDPTGPGGHPTAPGVVHQGYVNQQGNFVANLTSPVTTPQEPTYPDGSTTASEFLTNTLTPLSTAQKQWIDDTNNSTEVVKILDFLSINGRTVETKGFAREIIQAGADGTLISLFPLVKYPPGSNYATQYPKLTEFLKNQLPNIGDNAFIVNGIRRYTNLTTAQVQEHLKWGSGPTIKIDQLGDNYGEFRKNIDPNTLFLAVDLVNLLENSPPGSEIADAFAFLVGVTILHEYLHYADYNYYGDTWQYPQEEGLLFETDVYGKTVWIDNAIIVLKNHTE